MKMMFIVCLFVAVASIEAKRNGQVVLDTVKDMLDERMVRSYSHRAKANAKAKKIKDQVKGDQKKQECIPVGCVPAAH